MPEPSSPPLPTASPTKQRRKRQREIARVIRKVIKAGISFVVFFLLWEATIRLFEVRPYLVPAPTAVASALWDGFSSGLFLAAVRVTVTEVAWTSWPERSSGSRSRLCLFHELAVLDQIFYPYVVALQTVPKVRSLCFYHSGLASGIWVEDRYQSQ